MPLRQAPGERGGKEEETLPYSEIHSSTGGGLRMTGASLSTLKYAVLDNMV